MLNVVTSMETNFDSTQSAVFFLYQSLNFYVSKFALINYFFVTNLIYKSFLDSRKVCHQIERF